LIKGEHASTLVKGEIILSTARAKQSLEIDPCHGNPTQLATSVGNPSDFVKALQASVMISVQE